MNKSVMFISNHVWESKRRAGFHGLAGAFLHAGWRVTFVATGLSVLSALKNDRRLEGLDSKKYNILRHSEEGVTSYIYVPLLHPFSISNPYLELLVAPFVRGYGKHLPVNLAEKIGDTPLIFIESSPALFLAKTVRNLAPDTRLVYRVSDDVRAIRNNRYLQEAEDDALQYFDLISVPSRILLKRFVNEKSYFHPHGLDHAIFSGPHENPFKNPDRVAAVSVGSTLFDHDFIDIASEVCPEVDFHLVGDFSDKWKKTNVFLHGELPFQQAAAYSAHCDLALAPYRISAGAEYLAETSNKIIQYRYLRKAIVTHKTVANIINDPSVFGYDLSSPVTVKVAIEGALKLKVEKLQLQTPPSWDHVHQAILKDLG